jgi:transcriptional regulator GlxA family with amidase domain
VLSLSGSLNQEEGTITTPFDMTVLNDLDRLPLTGTEGLALKERLKAKHIDHMECHLSEPISLDVLAAHARTSRARLFANFKRETGMSPNDWLLRRRIKAATDLLRTTNRKLEDIAAACGFTSAPYFCHVFRKYTAPPGEHRQKV